jgi:D-3-phosphoglycerate dehydrogenase
VSDILSLHCPLTDRTRGLIGPRELALMKPGALLVNTARGAIVDEAALVERTAVGPTGRRGPRHLRHRAAAARPSLLAMEQVFLTPHVAGVTRQGRAGGGDDDGAQRRRRF